MKTFKNLCLLGIIAATICSCRNTIEPPVSTGTEVTEGVKTGMIKGFFVLNQGNKGSNKTTLDFFDYETGTYSRNIFGERNPEIAFEMGDLGNDIDIYGNKLYAVINGSSIIEVMDAQTVKHIAQITVPNCRYITFDKGYAYVTSYAGPIGVDPNAQRGYVAKIDTVSMQIVDTCHVGFQPEEMVIYKDRMYVANSGGYMAPDYDSTVSVIDLRTFAVAGGIEVAPNLHQMILGEDGMIYVSSRGDYVNPMPGVYIIDPEKDEMVFATDLPEMSNMWMCGEKLYAISNVWSNTDMCFKTTYPVFSISTRSTLSMNFITDGTEKEIISPYCIAVHPETGEILVSDAADYVTPGKIHCYTPDGVRKWSATAGDIPGNIVFSMKTVL